MPVKTYLITTCGDRKLVAKTCRGCGELKLGSDFKLRIGRGNVRPSYDSDCKACGHLRANQTNKRANEKSLEKATNYRAPWGKEEIARLKKLDDLGLSHRDIADRLGRTISGVFNRLQRLRVEIDEGGECMGIRGLDSLKQGDDREPEDSAEDLEVLTHPSQNEN